MDRTVEGERPLHLVLKSVPFDEFHGVVEKAIFAVPAEIINPNGVRMLKIPDCHDLTPKAFNHLVDIHRMSHEDLDGDLSIHRDLAREVDGTESALSKKRFDSVCLV